VARETLVVERRGTAGEVAVWTVSRPEAKNALDAATFAALGRALAHAEGDATLRAVVLTGAGDTFVSGGDLRELRAATTAEQAARLAEAGRQVCDAIARLRVPVLATACDVRVADARATMCFKHARMAVTTAWGILPKLVGMVGHGAASRLLLAAEEVDAREALRLGLVDAVTDDGGCVERAVAWGVEMVKAAPLASAALKALLREAIDPAAGVLASERERFIATWTSADHADAVEAFFEGRPPRWTGR
jgi:enoyl-CoA hydratase